MYVHRARMLDSPQLGAAAGCLLFLFVPDDIHT